MSLRLLSSCLALLAVPAFAASQEDMVKMTERQAAAVSAAAPDCDKMSKALLATADEDLATLKSLMASEAGKSKEQKKAEKSEFIQKYGPRLKEAQGKLGALKACKDNATFKQWKAKFDEATKPPSKG